MPLPAVASGPLTAERPETGLEPPHAPRPPFHDSATLALCPPLGASVIVASAQTAPVSVANTRKDDRGLLNSFRVSMDKDTGYAIGSSLAGSFDPFQP